MRSALHIFSPKLFLFQPLKSNPPSSTLIFFVLISHRIYYLVSSHITSHNIFRINLPLKKMDYFEHMYRETEEEVGISAQSEHRLEVVLFRRVHARVHLFLLILPWRPLILHARIYFCMLNSTSILPIRTDMRFHANKNASSTVQTYSKSLDSHSVCSQHARTHTHIHHRHNTQTHTHTPMQRLGK